MKCAVPSGAAAAWEESKEAARDAATRADQSFQKLTSFLMPEEPHESPGSPPPPPRLGLVALAQLFHRE